MKNMLMIGLLSTVALSGVANAQSEREIRKDQHAIEVKQVQLDDARERSDPADIKAANRQVDGARQELREDRRDQQTSRYDPPYRNWSQSTPAMGTRLRPKFYGIRYVISNPDYYGLGEPGRYERWIRYGDDVLRVNVRDGRVAEVLPRRYRDM